ncbi:carboxylate-amine ligase [Pyrinomonas methylaliphatogenes]|jgi:carboxylate-amine ligase|uniref:Putative glutamate--cysteine ligase 2 n=1 Tax=Pyrinomonas methylaliphatogenes TaxID=454194 RepID=A0A0B6WXF1_9BACT|nr:carboxylate-amine ligase [Pyrinomonas methylaliphatogenes]MBX5478680.1 carboxylate-amine ligase [Pyrinomonas methylaliphatogenes]CDM65751.1 carboxylate-amine ligase, YbdK family [Pyrinomonas methylaliphatogenes]
MFGKYTLGIEEEFQIVDPATRELRSHVSEILAEGRMLLGEQIKPEMIQSTVEVGTGVCRNIQEARAEIIRLRSIVSHLARKQGLAIVAASTHPFSHWLDQKIYEDKRYELLVEEVQVIARSLLIFGLHVHVGVEDRERAIHIMNAARYFLPHVLALSTSSPFWLGINTGFKSYRSEIFKKFPRTDIPDHFDSYASFERYVDLLIRTNCIDNGKKIWWDVRPHPFFPTLEFRVCDIPTRVDDTIAIAALFQAIVAKLDKLIEQNLGFRLYRRMLIQENKWRAVRYGLDGKLIDFGKQKEVPVRDLIRELLQFVDDVVDELGSRREIEHIHRILERGTSAEEQLRVYRETGDLRAVVDRLIELTMENVPYEPSGVEKAQCG